MGEAPQPRGQCYLSQIQWECPRYNFNIGHSNDQGTMLWFRTFMPMLILFALIHPMHCLRDHIRHPCFWICLWTQILSPESCTAPSWSNGFLTMPLRLGSPIYSRPPMWFLGHRTLIENVRIENLSISRLFTMFIFLPAKLGYGPEHEWWDCQGPDHMLEVAWSYFGKNVLIFGEAPPENKVLRVSWFVQIIPNCLSKIRFDKPDDGLPCIEDWVGTFESILFGGLDLGREPLDGSVSMQGGTGF